MIRGTIEYVSERQIGGWVYSPYIETRDQTVMAFLDGKCIGAGRVEIFRQDLADAGLGDGFQGFNFPIELDDPADRDRVVLRFESGDVMLLQSGSKVVSAASTRAEATGVAHSLANLDWMRGRGWLDQAEFDFLKYVSQNGVYDRSLLGPKSAGGGERQKLDPAETAKALFELYHMGAVTLQQQVVASAESLIQLAAEIAEGGIGRGPLLAIWSSNRGHIAVGEGSHKRAGGAEARAAALEAAIDWPYGPDRLLFLDSRCAFQARTPAVTGDLVVFAA